MIISKALFVISNTKVNKCPSDNRREYAFIGRSNVGNSSLINMLAGRKDLAKTSATPGKTLLINHFLINDDWYLVDLPGYGYAKRSKEGRAEIERIIKSYILEREQLTNLFVLIDIRHEPQKIDMEFIEWLGQSQIPFAIIFTKADKIGNEQKAKKAARAYMDTLKEQWEELPPYFVTSSDKKIGRDDVLDYIDQINKEIEK